MARATGILLTLAVLFANTVCLCAVGAGRAEGVRRDRQARDRQPHDRQARAEGPAHACCHDQGGGPAGRDDRTDEPGREHRRPDDGHPDGRPCGHCTGAFAAADPTPNADPSAPAPSPLAVDAPAWTSALAADSPEPASPLPTGLPPPVSPPTLLTLGSMLTT